MQFLNDLVAYYERPSFIDNDPISACYWFDQPKDQEVVGLYAATLAWGRRETTISKMAELCDRMRQNPFRFVWNFDLSFDAAQLEGFKHRTFSSEDAIWFTANLRRLLRHHKTVEGIFSSSHSPENDSTREAIQGFSEKMLGAHEETPARMRKHLAQPQRGSAAKRLCTYLRWMVRPGPVDLGLWTRIGTHQLTLPLDVHCGRQARDLGVLSRKSNDWNAVMELTKACRKLCPEDPCRYDFAFFGLGVSGGAPAHLEHLFPI